MTAARGLLVIQPGNPVKLMARHLKYVSEYENLATGRSATPLYRPRKGKRPRAARKP
jgi:hypothetical protein